MTVDDKADEKRAAVYVPFKTLLTSIETFGQGLPDQIDVSAWQSLSGGVRSQVFSGYKFLGFIDDKGNVQQPLRDLVAKGDQRNPLLAGLLRERYSALVTAAESNATQAQFEDLMRTEYNVAGETLEKAMRFYLQAAAALDLPVSKLWKKKAGGTRRATRKTTGRRDDTPDVDDDDDEIDEEPPGDSVEIDFDGTGTLILTVSIAPTKLPKAHRDFVFKLIDEVNEYKENMQGPKATINGHSVPAVIEA
jgi:hypothetical protein